MSVLVLFSGGLDSSVCLAEAVASGEPVTALTFDYGQSNLREVELARALALAWGVAHKVEGLSLPNSDATIEIPARNTIFLAFALATALADGHSVVSIGAEPDATYVDSSVPYLVAMRAVFRLHGVDLVWPVKTLANKREVVERALDLGVPLAGVHPSRTNSVDGGCSTSRLYLAALGNLFPGIDPLRLLLYVRQATTEPERGGFALGHPGGSFKALPALFLLASLEQPLTSYKVYTTGNWGRALTWAALVLNIEVTFDIVQTKDVTLLSRNTLNTDSRAAVWGTKQALSGIPRRGPVTCRVVQGHLRKAIQGLGIEWSDNGVPLFT